MAEGVGDLEKTARGNHQLESISKDEADELLRLQADYARGYSRLKKAPRYLRTLPFRLGNRQRQLRKHLDAALKPP